MPSNSYIEKVNDDVICFYLEFKDLSDTTYMNQRGHFGIKLNSLLVQVFIDYKDAIGDSIVYNL